MRTCMLGHSNSQTAYAGVGQPRWPVSAAAAGEAIPSPQLHLQCETAADQPIKLPTPARMAVPDAPFDAQKCAISQHSTVSLALTCRAAKEALLRLPANSAVAGRQCNNLARLRWHTACASCTAVTVLHCNRPSTHARGGSVHRHYNGSHALYCKHRSYGIPCKASPAVRAQQFLARKPSPTAAAAAEGTAAVS